MAGEGPGEAVGAPVVFRDRANFRDAVAGNVIYYSESAVQSVPKPAQLPLEIAAFVGRDSIISRLDELVAASRRKYPQAVVITAIDGMPGVGKTALAIHWSRRIRDQFPDGQLYVDLRGASPRTALPVVEVLGRFLRALGVPADQITVDEGEMAALYRSLSADRKLLIMLDNAAAAEQVRPLLPGSPTCLVLVTSRNQLRGLVAHDGARSLTLDVLSPTEAVALIGAVAGSARVAAEPTAVAELARRCDYLPLAVRILAAQLAADPHLTIADLVRRLTGGDRLSVFAIHDDVRSGLRSAFELSYRGLTVGQRLAFRRLALIDGPDFSLLTATALLGRPTDETRRLIEALLMSSLVQTRAADRYHFHDLVRAYARERAAGEDGDEAVAAVIRRLLMWFLGATDAACSWLDRHRRRPARPETPDRLERSEFSARPDALRWLEAERPNLLAAVRQADGGEHADLVWHLADALRDFLDLRKYWAENLEVHLAGHAAARRVGDVRGEAVMLHNLARINFYLGRHETAMDLHQQALPLLHSTQDRYLEGRSLIEIGTIFRRLGDYDAALNHYRQALAVQYEIGDRHGAAQTLGHYGAINFYLAKYPDAIDYYERALAIQREIGDQQGESWSLGNLGFLLQRMGRLDEALKHHRRALVIRREIGDRYGEGWALNDLGTLHRRLGRYDEALDYHLRALRNRREIGALYAEGRALNDLGIVYQRLERYPEALEHHERALAIQREIGDRNGEGWTLNDLGVLYQRLGRYPEALECHERALAIQEDIGDRHATAETLRDLGRAERRLGDPTSAHAHWQQALKIFESLGTPETGELMGLLAEPD